MLCVGGFGSSLLEWGGGCVGGDKKCVQGRIGKNRECGAERYNPHPTRGRDRERRQIVTLV